MLFPILYIGSLIYYRKGMIAPQDMDFITGLKAIEEDTYVSFN